MKIYYLSQSRIPSRTANSMHVMKMAQAFVQLGYEFELFARHSAKAQAENNIELKTLYGLKQDIVVRLFHPYLGLEEYGIALQQSIRAKRGKADLILTRDIPTAAACVLLKIPTVLELHSPEMGPVKIRLFNWLIHRLNFAGLVTINQALKNEIISRHNYLSEAQVLVAPDAVDLERFADLPTATFARRYLGLFQEFTVGYAGHLYKGRGIELILEMAALIPDVRFLIVGGNEEDIQRCKKIMHSKNLVNIFFKGFVPNIDIPMYLSACDVLLMPYQNEVNVSGGSGNTVRWMSPMKVYEYLATSRPIISSDLPALREILSEKNSILCKCSDVSQWVSSINLLRKNSAFYAKLSSGCKEFIGEYTWSKRVRKIISHALRKDNLNL